MAGAEVAPIAGGAFKGAIDLVTRLMAAKPYADSQATLADLMKTITAMYGEYQSVSEANAALKTEVARFKDFRREAKKYKTNDEDSGVVTYALKEPGQPNEGKHRFCPNCYTNSKISRIQPTPKSEYDSRRGGWYRVHHCYSCDSDFTYDFKASSQIAHRSDMDSWKTF